MFNFAPNELTGMAREYCMLKARANKKHVSIITRGDMVESIACNGFEVPERYAFRGYRSLHSEVAAFMKLNCERNKLVLYNFRFNNEGKLKLSKPCTRCDPWVEAVFDYCWYSRDDGDFQLLGTERNTKYE